jgi:predicted enzyme related to lactoylglutathione lyase
MPEDAMPEDAMPEDAMPEHHKINYVEFASADPAATRSFFAATFGWQFEEYDSYLAFYGAGLDGGICPADPASRADAGGAVVGGALIVFYSADLAATERLVKQHGAAIVRPTFSFPGGRRFHFTEPAGNEFAVWSDR